ncbi:SCO3374 family protein [Streptomyces sp. NPDC048362]|uniref:SCO3374 family protein n=1 Tax=Streptomyces sp. NPDC048362 TaxID=3365539 RepID=UPI00371B2637
MARSSPVTPPESTTHTVPLPRRSPRPEPASPCRVPADPEARARHWYENDLGWATVPGGPLRLRTGVRFDVLDVPAEAGADALRHLAPGSPVSLWGDRMGLLVAAGSAEELPGLLDWLEWSAVGLDLRALGAGDTLAAPLEPTAPVASAVPPARYDGAAGPVPDGSVPGGAVWLRPPGRGCEVEASLPALPAMGRERSAPDFVRLVATVAAQCHRVRLRRVCAGPPACRRGRPSALSRTTRDQPLAFS